MSGPNANYRLAHSRNRLGKAIFRCILLVPFNATHMCLSGINHFYQVPLHSITKAEISIPNFPQEGCDMFLRKANDE